MIDLNPTRMREQGASAAINAAIDARIASEAADEPGRPYLGASAVGSDCLRKILWDWQRPAGFGAQTRRIFARGHWVEAYTTSLMVAAGFRIVRDGPDLAFSQLDGLFRGHGDGMITAGPAIEGVGYPCLWEHKGLGSKGWTKLQRDGLARTYPAYADQVALYQAYFGLTDHPAVFTAANMDTMEILHVLVPFDVERAQRVSDRAVSVIRHHLAGETPPRGSAKPDDFRCRFCSHREGCWDGAS